MTNLICNICGGSIIVQSETRGICEYCGAEVMLPRIDNDKRIEFLNKGNQLRMAGEFDLAYSTYQHIVSDDITDAEAHWNLMLCRYGINYVEELGEFKPTLGRLNFCSVFEDTDYLAALKYSDDYTREQYISRAKDIAEIQNKYTEIAKKEKPFDVFICFKDKDNRGERTKSSIVAQDWYEKLTDAGIKVFFSRITLESKVGKEYEPYIFAALHSAKVMLVFAESTEYINAIWVKNEWERYLTILENDPYKQLITVCAGMETSAVPDRLRKKVVSADAPGIEQDIIRGIRELCKKTVKEDVGQKKPVSAGGTQSSSGDLGKYYNLIVQSLKAEDFEQSLTLIESILNKQPTDARAHYYKLLACNRVQEYSQLDMSEDWENDVYYKRALMFSNAETKTYLDNVLILQQKERDYQRAIRYMDACQYELCIDIFKQLQGYRSSDSLLSEAEELYRQYQKKQKDTQAFREKVGDSNTYLIRQVEKKHPKELKNFYFRNKNARYGSYDNSVAIALAILVTAAFHIFFGIEAYHDSIWSAAVVESVVLAIGIGISLAIDDEFSFGMAVAIGAVPNVIIAIICSIFDSTIPSLIVGIGAAIWCIIDLVRAVVSHIKDSNQDALNAYFDNTVVKWMDEEKKILKREIDSQFDSDMSDLLDSVVVNGVSSFMNHYAQLFVNR